MRQWTACAAGVVVASCAICAAAWLWASGTPPERDNSEGTEVYSGPLVALDVGVGPDAVTRATPSLNPMPRQEFGPTPKIGEGPDLFSFVGESSALCDDAEWIIEGILFRD